MHPRLRRKAQLLAPKALKLKLPFLHGTRMLTHILPSLYVSGKKLDATLQLVEVRKGIRLYLKQEEAELRCRYTRIGFGAFFLNVQGRSVDARAGRQVERWLRDIHISIARAWSFLGHTCRALRDAVRTDRNRYLDQLARDVGLADVSCPQQLYRRVRKAFPKAATSRRTKFTSLPAVELLDGSLAPTNAAKEQRWREHFAEQESGVPVDAQKFQHLLTAADAHRSGAAVCFDSAMLPSLLSLETTILGLQRAKAAGADGITAELLRVAPLDSARPFAQSFMEVFVQDHLSSLAFLVDCGCTPHAIAVIQEVFTGTWFRLDHTVPLVATAAGVRPGDPLADLLFAVSFSAYVKSVATALDQKGLQTVLPACTSPMPWGDPIEEQPLSPASWADDFAAMHSATEPARLVDCVRLATEVYLAHATANGIELAFAPDKTAAVLPPKVCFRQELGVVREGDSYYLPVCDGITGKIQQMPVVQAYKHLGGIVTAAGTASPEIYFRHSQACWTLRPLRGILFGNPSIPLPTRRLLLQSLVTSKFAFGSATLELHVASHWRLWARLYTAIFRALQPRSALLNKLHSYDVLRHAAACTPILALAKARASFLARLSKHGPQVLRHLLWLQWEASPEKSWLGQLVGDIQHVAQYCDGAKVLLSSSKPLHALLAAMSEEPTWWLRQIRAAIRICLEDLDNWQPSAAADAPG
ncbi:hypothetical protein AK812_SmicGene22806 [Symbiodinium microadriaticum]|uniref:Uncharacterized protein n=1 Tax=Symbiodinium microadriaticum TaxID=2951 RepID=A0A1Q9DIW8_SYMMI|nr:hypothetical protein AK812_SmicGene22806 [Symbiodinium microadriaticum]